MRLTTKLHGSSRVLVFRSCPPTTGIASSRMAWLHMYSLAFSYGTHPCTTPYCTCSVRREATCSLSYEQTQVHPLPSLVLAREATGCVTDFCWHNPVHIVMPRKNPALCDLAFRASCLSGSRQPVALAANLLISFRQFALGRAASP